MGTGEVMQLARCLLDKHEDLSLDPQSTHKKLGAEHRE